MAGLRFWRRPSLDISDSGESNDNLWLFNHRLWLGALLAGAGAGLLAAGLVAIHETIKLLFGLTIAQNAAEYILTVSLGFVAPVSFLAFAPRSFTDTITERESQDFTMRAAAALVKFVAVPLLLVYTAILYAYAAKIALAWELPQGTLGAMVVGYLFAGAATLLLGYPTRETGGPLVRLFWRYWVWLAALPVALLFIAVWRQDRRLRPDRAALSDGADRRLGAGPRGLPHRARRALRSAAHAGRTGVAAAGGLARTWRRHRTFCVEPEGRARLDPFRQGYSGRRQDRAARRRAPPRTRSASRRPAPAPSNGISTPITRSACLRRGSRATPTIPSRRGRRPKRPRASCWSRSGLRPDIGATGGAVHFTHYSDVPAVLVPEKGGYVVGPIVFETRRRRRRFRPRASRSRGLAPSKLELSDKLLTGESRRWRRGELRHVRGCEGGLPARLAEGDGSPADRAEGRELAASTARWSSTI